MIRNKSGNVITVPHIETSITDILLVLLTTDITYCYICLVHKNTHGQFNLVHKSLVTEANCPSEEKICIPLI